jgi:hypothetical protein
MEAWVKSQLHIYKHSLCRSGILYAEIFAGDGMIPGVLQELMPVFENTFQSSNSTRIHA